jgi:hypothetical protein
MGDYEALTSKGLPVLAVDLRTDLATGLKFFQMKIDVYFKQDSLI